MAKQKNNPQMERLLESKKAPQLPQEGQLIKGQVLNMGTNRIYMDLGPLGTGVVLGPEIQDGLKTAQELSEGDRVSATIVEWENENGYTELSLRQAGEEKAWQGLQEKYQNQETLEVKIRSANRGGLVTEVNGITAFLPVSQLAMEHYPRVKKDNRNKILKILRGYINHLFKVKIINLDRDQSELILSEKKAYQEQRQNLIDQLEIGQVVEGKITGIADFGAFIKFQVPEREDEEYLEGLVHISELAWQRVEKPQNIVQKGDLAKAKIINIKNDRIALSLRQLEEDPWQEAGEKYEAGQKVEGKVTKIDHFGAFVKLDEDIQGLAHISQFGQEMPLKEGQTYPFKITSLEPNEHRLQLTYASNQEKTQK